MRLEGKSALGRDHAGQRPKLGAEPPDLDAQAGAMRFVGLPGPEGPPDERVPRHVAGPGLAERACEREQYRTRRERDDRAGAAHDMAAGVYDERRRRQQGLDILEQEEPLAALRDQARRGRAQDEGCAFDLRRQCRDAAPRGALGPGECRARRLRPKAADRDAGDDQLAGGPHRRRQWCRLWPGQRLLGLVEAADQQQAPNLEISRVRGVDAVAMRQECRPGRGERLRGPGQIARDEGDLGLGDDAPRTGHRLFRAEGARRSAQEGLRPVEIAELRHGDAAKRQARARRRAAPPASGHPGDRPSRARAPRR